MKTYLSTQIYGKSADFNDKNIEIVKFHWYETEKRILRKKTELGNEILFKFMKEGTRIEHQDVVYQENDLIIVAEIEECEVIILTPKNFSDIARTAYEIGNKHSPLFLNEDELILPFDKPMFLWLEAAGFHPHKGNRILSKALRANSAQGNFSEVPSHTH